MMSYMSLLAIIEHMDPNLRFHLSRTCPAICKLEKSAPLKIRKLILKRWKLQINDVIYGIDDVNNNGHTPFSFGTLNPELLVWTGPPLNVVEYFVGKFLGKRIEPVVSETVEVEIQTFPKSLKLKTQNLQINSNPVEVFRNISLDPSSSPLKSITLDWSVFPMESPIFQEAQNLIIRKIDVNHIWQNLEHLPQKNIHFLNLGGITTTVHMCKKKMVEHKLQKRCSFGILDFKTNEFFVNYWHGLWTTGSIKKQMNPETKNTIRSFRLVQNVEDDLEMHYYYEKIPDYNNKELQDGGLGWNFVMEMLPVGTFPILNSVYEFF